MQGRPDGPNFSYYSGTQTIQKELKQAQKELDLFTTFKYIVTGITGEGERVAIESISEGSGPSEGQIHI